MPSPQASRILEAMNSSDSACGSSLSSGAWELLYLHASMKHRVILQSAVHLLRGLQLRQEVYKLGSRLLPKNGLSKLLE